ncbi:hypothetical protein RGQ29_032794 [Quercus rubra]|uniref:BED-type domain-containing protein n=1 Tax=Quercus rubra TaxID=3512 RepID=A0AAN7DUQ1_QUERU|nr:hypothetical protein RGQ29_032794 [Quercus rubra]
MTENQSSVASGPVVRSEDPAWAYGRAVPDARNNTQCTFCGKMIRGGGITRLKYHLAGIPGDVGACKKVSEDVKWQMKQLIEDLKKSKQKKRRMNKEISNPYDVIMIMREGVQRVIHQLVIITPRGKKKLEKKSNIKSYFAPRTKPGSQPSIRSSLASKQMVEKARMNFARWWYHANIPFHAAHSVYYQEALDSVAAIGPGFKGPSYHDLRGPLLQKHVGEMNDYLLDVKNDWKVYGCSIMSDGWTNQKRAPIINFLVYCPRGTMFLKSLDVSGLTKDADTLFKLFDKVVQEVGPENVVQFITDNDSSYKSAGKKLMQKYGTFYWSPCAAHCIDLMLENFSDKRYFPIIDETIQKAKKITKFIYNHGKILALMRSNFTNGRDLIRPAITRFATEFLSLQCLTKFKKELRQMFTCDQWVESRHARDVMGKEVAAIVLEDREFWLQCQQIVKISEPLVRVLRLVDGDEKPSMGYLYEAMDKAKENIKARLKNKISAYIPFTSVIDARWDRQLHSPLHAAGCYLNPGIFFRPSFKKQKDVTNGLLSSITRLVSDPDEQDILSSQIESYKKSLGDFGMPMAIRQREKLSPVLSQCCSATGCERAWSTFEFIHSKRRNRLEHKHLNDLVYVRYNLLLRERNIRRTKDYLDPISLDNIDLMEDWVAEESEFLLVTEEDVSWDSIEEPLTTMTLEDDNDDDDDVVVLDEEDGENDVVLTDANTHVYYGPDVNPFEGWE